MLAATISSKLRLSIFFQKRHCHAAACQNVDPRTATNQPFAGLFFQFGIVLSRFFTITPSLLPIYFSVAADSLLKERWCFSQCVLEAVAANTSDSYTQPKPTALLWISLWAISRHAHAILHIHPPRHSLQKETFCSLPLRYFHTSDKTKAGNISHFDFALRKPADDFHQFRNRLCQSRDRCREER